VNFTGGGEEMYWGRGDKNLSKKEGSGFLSSGGGREKGYLTSFLAGVGALV